MVYLDGIMRRKIKLWVALLILLVIVAVAAFAITAQAEAERRARLEQARLALVSIQQNQQNARTFQPSAVTNELADAIAQAEYYEFLSQQAASTVTATDTAEEKLLQSVATVLLKDDEQSYEEDVATIQEEASATFQIAASGGSGGIIFGGLITKVGNNCQYDPNQNTCPNCPLCGKILGSQCRNFQEVVFIPVGPTPTNFICNPKGFSFVGQAPKVGEFLLGTGDSLTSPQAVGISVPFDNLPSL